MDDYCEYCKMPLADGVCIVCRRAPAPDEKELGSIEINVILDDDDRSRLVAQARLFLEMPEKHRMTITWGDGKQLTGMRAGWLLHRRLVVAGLHYEAAEFARLLGTPHLVGSDDE